MSSSSSASELNAPSQRTDISGLEKDPFWDPHQIGSSDGSSISTKLSLVQPSHNGQGNGECHQQAFKRIHFDSHTKMEPSSWQEPSVGWLGPVGSTLPIGKANEVDPMVSDVGFDDGRVLSSNSPLGKNFQGGHEVCRPKATKLNLNFDWVQNHHPFNINNAEIQNGPGSAFHNFKPHDLSGTVVLGGDSKNKKANLSLDRPGYDAPGHSQHHQPIKENNPNSKKDADSFLPITALGHAAFRENEVHQLSPSEMGLDITAGSLGLPGSSFQNPRVDSTLNQPSEELRLAANHVFGQVRRIKTEDPSSSEARSRAELKKIEDELRYNRKTVGSSNHPSDELYNGIGVPNQTQNSADVMNGDQPAYSSTKERFEGGRDKLSPITPPEPTKGKSKEQNFELNNIEPEFWAWISIIQEKFKGYIYKELKEYVAPLIPKLAFCLIPGEKKMKKVARKVLIMKNPKMMERMGSFTYTLWAVNHRVLETLGADQSPDSFLEHQKKTLHSFLRLMLNFKEYTLGKFGNQFKSLHKKLFEAICLNEVTLDQKVFQINFSGIHIQVSQRQLIINEAVVQFLILHYRMKNEKKWEEIVGEDEKFLNFAHFGDHWEDRPKTSLKESGVEYEALEHLLPWENHFPNNISGFSLDIFKLEMVKYKHCVKASELVNESSNFSDRPTNKLKETVQNEALSHQSAQGNYCPTSRRGFSCGTYKIGMYKFVHNGKPADSMSESSNFKFVYLEAPDPIYWAWISRFKDEFSRPHSFIIPKIDEVVEVWVKETRGKLEKASVKDEDLSIHLHSKMDTLFNHLWVVKAGILDTLGYGMSQESFTKQQASVQSFLVEILSGVNVTNEYGHPVLPEKENFFHRSESKELYDLMLKFFDLKQNDIVYHSKIRVYANGDSDVLEEDLILTQIVVNILGYYYKIKNNEKWKGIFKTEKRLFNFIVCCRSRLYHGYKSDGKARVQHLRFQSMNLVPWELKYVPSPIVDSISIQHSFSVKPQHQLEKSIHKI
ncbi:hypothetical protein PGT21_031407 [Puccinia graminis f. sp. tritici]|uniref:Uncharacterized protein n=2 Tax=Puccinia graminis f. sp. tritici TaxID=56615 RepID=A0A5B0PF29_PUCGR|nr:hypothetical protein PGT21_031407 [Puccinia graminis f. sp. tritici]